MYIHEQWNDGIHTEVFIKIHNTLIPEYLGDAIMEKFFAIYFCIEYL